MRRSVLKSVCVLRNSTAYETESWSLSKGPGRVCVLCAVGARGPGSWTSFPATSVSWPEQGMTAVEGIFPEVVEASEMHAALACVLS